MSLAGIIASTPKHQTTLPVSGKKIEYRPFIVKEEKILLMAAESKDEKTINAAIREVISACTSGAVDVFKLPLVDMLVSCTDAATAMPLSSEPVT